MKRKKYHMLLYKIYLVYIILYEHVFFILRCNVFIGKKRSFEKVKNKYIVSFDTSHTATLVH